MPSEDPKAVRHKTLRLPDYDYGQEGAYFITICTANQASILGNIDHITFHPSKIGKIVEEEWLRSTEIRATIELDAHVLMPNHFHGIVFITEDDRPAPGSPGFRSPSRTIGALVRGFKGATTSRLLRERLIRAGSIWQRNCYEHVIRSENALQQIREYIVNNPASWAQDRFHTD